MSLKLAALALSFLSKSNLKTLNFGIIFGFRWHVECFQNFAQLKLKSNSRMFSINIESRIRTRCLKSTTSGRDQQSTREMSKNASMRWNGAEFWLANILFQLFGVPDVYDQPMATLPGKPLK